MVVVLGGELAEGGREAVGSATGGKEVIFQLYS